MNDINSMAYWKKIDDVQLKLDKDPALLEKCKADPITFIKEQGLDVPIKINDKGDTQLLSEYLTINKIDFSKEVSLVGKRPGDNLAVFIFVNVAANANAAANANVIANANVVVNSNVFGKPVYPESIARVVSQVSGTDDPVKSSAESKSSVQVKANTFGVAPEALSKTQTTANVKVHTDILSDAKVKTSVAGQGPSRPNAVVTSDGIANVLVKSTVISDVKAKVNVTTHGRPAASLTSVKTKVSTSTDGDGEGIIERPRPDLRVKTLAAGLDVRPIRPIKPIEPIEPKPVRPIRPGRPMRPIATIENEDAKKYLIGEYEVTYEMSDETYEIFKKELDKQNLSKERQQAVIKRAVTNPDRVLDAKVFKCEDSTKKELKQAEIKREVSLGDKRAAERLSKEMIEMIEAKKYSLDETIEYQYKDKRFRMHITVSGKHVTINNVEVTDDE